ncbi:unnamed protein product [Blepharisma stoltei]|uniref:Receptor ligand binding region domain-containing protein n=1 Tax=Blepharisma stoltei TaxID=1481888 RepID=A0AAU9I734_9CILI|nr:unnamed protein product [Blepharisma stoltei]
MSIILYIIWNSFTNLSLISDIKALIDQNFQDQADFSLVFSQNLSGSHLTAGSQNIILDLGFDWSLSKSIKEFAEENQAIIINIHRSIGSFSEWEFFTHCSWKDQSEALFIVTTYLNWQKFIVISDEIYNQDDEFFNLFYDKDYQWYFFSNCNDENSADLFIGKIIQSIGIRNIVILNKGESARLLLKSLEQHNFLINGTGIIVGSEGSWGLYGNGAISYAESGLESANSYNSYESLSIIKFLKLVFNFPPASSSLELLEFLNKNTINHHPISNFTLLNMENNKTIGKGSIFDRNLTISNPLNFPGNSSIIPNSPTTDVNIWIGDGTKNPNSPSDPSSTRSMLGEYLALSYWKSLHALDGFNITVTHTDCGALAYNATLGLSCFSNLLATPGVGYLTSLYPFIAIGYIYTLRSLNCSIPNISPYAPSNLLQNQTLFPEFMTVTKDDRFNIQVILDLAVVFGWKRFIVAYDKENIESYKYFLAKIEQFNMEIVNNPDQRMIESYYTVDKYSEWENWFKSIISLKARLFIIFFAPPYWFNVVESFYDAGLRIGDSIFLFNAKVVYSMIWEKNPKQLNKLIEILYGTVIINQAEWIGDFGKTMKRDYIITYGKSTDFRCLAFDAAMLLLNGIEFTIKQGKNVMNYEIMNSSLRKQKFLGCSGTVSIEQGSNQRSLPTIGIYNIKWNNSAQSLYEDFVGKYDASSVQLITLYSSIIWYDNTTIIPTDLIIYENGCPFPEKLIFRSEKGAGILYLISGSLIIITAIEALFIWKMFWKNIKIEKLKNAVQAHIEDYFLMGILAVDSLQFISQGPDIPESFLWLSKACSYSLVNFDSSVNGNLYWGYLYIAQIISCYWVITAFILICKLFNINSAILQYARSLALLLLPIIGHFLFVPIISVLLSIFQCDQGVDSNITDSFIRQDCNTYCWDNKYFIWGSFSIASLVTYIPLSINFRYFHQNINDYINIKMKPIFILEKAIFQVIIVSMNKTLKIYDESLHGLCCIILISIMILLSFKQRPYNYIRMNIWLIISYFGILWSFILSSLYWYTKFEALMMWTLLQYSVWFWLIIIGVLIQFKFFPSLLLTEKAADISIFFRFSIGSKISAIEINKMLKEIRDKTMFKSSYLNIDSQSGSNSKDNIIPE